jgi:hypothetical protein
LHRFNVGAGKTFTFFGPDALSFQPAAHGTALPADTGIVIRVCEELLEARKTMLRAGVIVSISAQFVEIYDEQVSTDTRNAISMHANGFKV